MTWSRQQPPRIMWPNHDLRAAPILPGINAGALTATASLIKQSAPDTSFPNVSSPVKITPADEWRALFHLSSPIRPPQTCLFFVSAGDLNIEATSLYSPGGGAAFGTIRLQPVTENWPPNFVTWNNQPTSLLGSYSGYQYQHDIMGGALTIDYTNEDTDPSAENGSAKAFAIYTQPTSTIYGFMLYIDPITDDWPLGSVTQELGDFSVYYVSPYRPV